MSSFSNKSRLPSIRNSYTTASRDVPDDSHIKHMRQLVTEMEPPYARCSKKFFDIETGKDSQCDEILKEGFWMQVVKWVPDEKGGEKKVWDPSFKPYCEEHVADTRYAQYVEIKSDDIQTAFRRNHPLKSILPPTAESVEPVVDQENKPPKFMFKLEFPSEGPLVPKFLPFIPVRESNDLGKPASVSEK
jgi:hypothetical protein